MKKLIEKMEKEIHGSFEHSWACGRKMKNCMCLGGTFYRQVIKPMLPSLLQAVGEEIIGKDSKHDLSVRHNIRATLNEIKTMEFCDSCKLINQEKAQQRSRLKEVISSVKKV